MLAALRFLVCGLLMLAGTGSASKEVGTASEAARGVKVAAPRTLKDDDDDLDLDGLLDDDSDSLLDDDEDEDKDDDEDEEPTEKPEREASEEKDKDEESGDADEAGASAEDEDEEKASAKGDDDDEEKDEDEPEEEENAEADDEEAEEKPKTRAAKSEDDDDGGDDEAEDKKKSEAADADAGEGEAKEATDADQTIPQDTHLQMAQRIPAKGEAAAAGDEEQPNLSPDVVARLAAAQAALREADEALSEARAEMDGRAPEAAEAEGAEEPAPEEGGLDFQLVKEIAIPIVAFVIGAILHRSESTAVYGKLAMFFGAQTVMNLYMKEVLSGAVVDEEAGLHGFPSAFIVTALQQLVGFLCFSVILLVLACTPYAYTPKKISEPMEVLAVILFSFSFTLNIALNNFSISLLPLSVNLIIRSCLPLATFVSQRLASKCTNEPVKDARVIEILCMLLGVFFAAVAVVAKSHGGGGDEGQSKTLVFGVIVCVASLFSGAINLALAGVLGTSCKLNSLDTTVYMSVPAFLFLVLPSFLYRHPVSWPGHGSMTDWEVMLVVLDKNVSVVGLAAFSGVLALFYNVFQYGIVHSLSASYTAFAGNFNKAATIALGLLVGLERLPPGIWGVVMALACLGNIGAFTAFNVIKMQARKDEPKKEADSHGDEKAELIADADKGKV